MSDHDDHLRPPSSRSRRRIPRSVVRPLQEFLATSTASATLLFAAAALALVWANLGDSYEAFWTTPLVLRVGDVTIGTDLRFQRQGGGEDAASGPGGRHDASGVADALGEAGASPATSRRTASKEMIRQSSSSGDRKYDAVCSMSV